MSNRIIRWAMAAALAASLALAGCQGSGNQSADAVANNVLADLDVGYVSSEFGIVRAMLDLAQVGPNDLVVDLGSGDGRIPILAAKEKGARGLGVELDPRRIQESNANAAREGVAGRVEFRQQDLFVTPLNDVTVLTLYLLPEINLQLRPKILAQMRPGTRVVSNSYDMGDWRPDSERSVENTRIFLWLVPAQVEGRWQFQIEGGGSGELTLDQLYQTFSGSGRIDQGRIQGDRISFTADLGQGRRRYEGRVNGNTIEGQGWRATKVG